MTTEAKKVNHTKSVGKCLTFCTDQIDQFNKSQKTALASILATKIDSMAFFLQDNRQKGRFCEFKWHSLASIVHP